MTNDPVSSDQVRLTKDIPELYLSRGAIGVVCSTWCSPMTAYEVEFAPPDECAVRVLLMPGDFTVEPRHLRP